MHSRVFTLLSCASLSAAHFVLRWPPTAGFVDDQEPNSPCGGFTPAVNASSPNITVDQFAIQIFSSHPAGEWSFLGAPSTQQPLNFTPIVPVVNTTGPGNFCLQEMKVPSDWAGKSGVIQVIDHSVDGFLYQCAAVNFVSGSNSTAGPGCTNATSFTATWTNIQSVNGSANSTSTSSTPPSSSVSTSTHHGAAAAATVAGSVLSGLGLLAVGFAL